jgi:quercetin dioxygenase-like cupin family protein
MDFVNAIAKARFNSARPQRVQISRSSGLAVELLCMEAGQELSAGAATVPCAYYVVTGAARFTVAGADRDLPAGQLAAAVGNERYTLANAGQGRLVCLVVRPDGQ